jgi:hypothetical protein
MGYNHANVADSVAAGFTPAEADAFELVRVAASACLRLTENEPHHGLEREEMCHGFHVVQNWLASRPTMRRLEAAAAERTAAEVVPDGF